MYLLMYRETESLMYGYAASGKLSMQAQQVKSFAPTAYPRLMELNLKQLMQRLFAYYTISKKR